MVVTSPKSIEEVIGHNIRSVEVIHQLYGEEGIRNLRNNVEKVCLVSLFSGLGGAELMVMNNYVAVSKKCLELGMDPPKRPRSSVAFVISWNDLASGNFFVRVPFSSTTVGPWRLIC